MLYVISFTRSQSDYIKRYRYSISFHAFKIAFYLLMHKFSEFNDVAAAVFGK